MRNAASLWWETALLSVVESWSMRAEEPSREDGAALLVGSYEELWKPGGMLASPVPLIALQRAGFERFTVEHGSF